MLFRSQVPAGWVVVTAGNPPEFNKSVSEFDIVTLDRVKRVEMYRAVLEALQLPYWLDM